MSRKKIAFVIQSLGVGGAEKFLISVANHFYRCGYEPYVVLLSNDRTLLPELNSGIPVVTFLKRSRWDILISFRIRNWIRSENITKIFCVNSYAFFLTKLAFLGNKKHSFFVSLHSTIPFSIKYYWQNLIYFKALSKRDTVIYLCNNQKQFLQHTYYFSTPEAPVVYNGIDTKYFDPDLFDDFDANACRTRLRIGADDKVIIQVARLQAEKRHTDAIDALAILHNNHNTKAHLLLLGSGEAGYSQFVRDYAKKKGLADFVHFLGQQADVRCFYLVADIFTLTSNSETFSLSALEAMAFGLRCSLTDVGGAAEMTIEGVTGSLSKKEDPQSIACSWHKLLGKPMDRKSVRQYVTDHFTSGRMLDEYVKLIN